jgi:hypothetical protein
MESEIPHHIYGLTSPVPILSYSKPVHIFPCQFLKIPFYIILPCTLSSSKWSLTIRSTHQNPVRSTQYVLHSTSIHLFMIYLHK